MVGDPVNPAYVEGLELCDPNDTSPGPDNCLAIRDSGLILVNPDGVRRGDNGFDRSYSMRSIPHLLSLSRSIAPVSGGPAAQLGWGGDGAPGTGSLHEFATGAVSQHFTLHVNRSSGDFRPPTEDELHAMEAFQLELGRKNEIDLESIVFFDNKAIAGKPIFQARCARCHANAGALAGTINTNVRIPTRSRVFHIGSTEWTSRRSSVASSRQIPTSSGLGDSA